MRRSAPSAITSVAVLVFAAACGHTSETLDAFEKAKQSGSNAGTNGDSCGAGTGGASGTGNTGSQFSCTQVGSQQFDPDTMQAYSVSRGVADDVSDTLASMDLPAKASQMLGIPYKRDFQDIERSPDQDVPGFGTIRGYNYRDAGRGVNLDAGQPDRAHTGGNYSTVFPAPSIRAASWDLDLEKRVGAAAGDETVASHNNMLLAPCMNIIRHPYWGRTQETYGEDTYHVGRMATAFTVGLQEYVTGCAKHFAANNIEKGRSTQNAVIPLEQTLREIYGRHFEMVVQDGGVGCIMAAYNLINDVKSTQNGHLLRDILKAPIEEGGFGFQGLVISDWWAMPGYQTVSDQPQSVANEALEAGLDVEVPWQLHFKPDTLAAVPDADKPLIDDAAKRVLTQKFRFKSALKTQGWGLTCASSTLTSDGSIATNTSHEALAEEAAVKSAVLVYNGSSATPLLPLTSAMNIAVVGPDQYFKLYTGTPPKSCPPSSDRSCTFNFATDPALGDRGSSRVNGDPARSVAPFAGIQMAAPMGAVVSSAKTPDAAEVAAADTVVVVVGYTPGDEGEEYAISEGGDRSTLDLPAGQNEFVSRVLDSMKPTVIVIESGSIVNMPWLGHRNAQQATIWAGYPGMRGGAALGKLIFGVANFSGKVPLAWPTQAEQDLMSFKDSDTVTTMGYYFGYREYDRRKYVDGQTVDLVFPFGWGMSYSTFVYSNLALPCQTVTKDAIFEVAVDIENTSAVDGDEVAMLFVKPPYTPPAKPPGISGERAWKELKSFARVTVGAGQTITARLPLRIRDLRHWEGGANGRWVIDSGDYTILVGKNADDAETTTIRGTVTVQGD